MVSAAIALQHLADLLAIIVVRGAIAAGNIAVCGTIAALSVGGDLKAAGQENEAKVRFT